MSNLPKKQSTVTVSSFRGGSCIKWYNYDHICAPVRSDSNSLSCLCLPLEFKCMLSLHVLLYSVCHNAGLIIHTGFSF